MSETLLLALVALCSIGGGFFTAAIGFGGAIFLMLFFPHFLPFLEASALSSVIVYSGIVLLAVEYRQYIRWKELPTPVIVYTLCGVAAIYISRVTDISGLKLAFSLFIILLGLYHLFETMAGANKLRVKKKLAVIPCSILSGLGTGFFGIGGPPMALYFFSVTEGDSKVYIGTIQAFFSICMFFTIGARVVSGILTARQLPLMLAGAAGAYAGKWLGTAFMSHVKPRLLRLCICAFMLFSGTVYLIEYLA